MEDAGFTLTEDWQPGWYISGVELAAITGTIAATLAAVTNAVVGTVAVAGTIAATTAPLTNAVAGTVAVAGAIAAGTAAATAALVGEVAIGGSITAALAKLAGALAGNVAISGEIDCTLSPVTCYATDSTGVTLRAFSRIPGLKIVSIYIHKLTLRIKIP